MSHPSELMPQSMVESGYPLGSGHLRPFVNNPPSTPGFGIPAAAFWRPLLL